MHSNIVIQRDINRRQRFQQTGRGLRRNAWAFFFSLAVAMLLVSPACAQTLYGTLVGNVTDTSGAAVVGATVTATEPATGLAAAATTDNFGGYRLSNLAPGTYVVSVAAKSFGTVNSRDVVLQ
jgi:hypothetical protein